MQRVASLLGRRTVLGGMSAVAAAAVLASRSSAQDATPAAGEWTYTDVLGTTVTLPETPVRIVANIVTAAALWDLGIHPVGVFDWTVSNYPDGDHIAWGNIPADQVVNVGNADGNIEPEMLLTLDPDIAAFTFWSAVHGAISLALRRRAPFTDVDPGVIATQAVETMMALTRTTASERG